MASNSVSRALALLDYLRQRRTASIGETARALGIKPGALRTLVDNLSAVGFGDRGYDRSLVIDIDPDNSGDLHLVQDLDIGFRLRLSAQEAASICAALDVLAQGAQPAQRAVIAAALTKIVRGTNLAGLAGAQPATPVGCAQAVLARLRRASSSRLAVDIDYVSREGRTRRLIEPAGFSVIEGEWYVRAWCRKRNGWRTFRVANIDSARVSDLSAPVREPDASSQPGLSATLRVRRADRWVCDLPQVDSFRALSRDCYEVVVRAFDRDWLVSFVLSLGAAATVVKPQSLARAVRAAARAALANYPDDPAVR